MEYIQFTRVCLGIFLHYSFKYLIDLEHHFTCFLELLGLPCVPIISLHMFVFCFLIFYPHLRTCLERGRERERFLCTSPNLVSNWQPFSAQDDSRPTATPAGLYFVFGTAFWELDISVSIPLHYFYNVFVFTFSSSSGYDFLFQGY